MLDWIQALSPLFSALIGVFTYSREENTPSYDYPNQIDEDIKKKRLGEVMKLQQSIITGP